MAIKILATGDLHIGQSASGLSENSETFAARDTWKTIVDWAIRNQVDIIVLTGDIIDRENRFFEAVGSLQSGFNRLNENSIIVFMVAGNHDFDVLPQAIQSGKYENVRLLGEGGKWEAARFDKGTDSVQFLGWSFPSQFITYDPVEKLTAGLTEKGIPVIGLLHCEAEAREGHYAPAKVSGLTNVKADLWVLGHIHKPMNFDDGKTFIRYPGSPLAFSPKETGFHSTILITVGNGQVEEPVNVIFSPVRFEPLAVDITGCKTIDQYTITINDAITSNEIIPEEEYIELRYLVFDLTLTGISDDISKIEDWSAGFVKDFQHETVHGTIIRVRKIDLDLQPAVSNLDELAMQETPAGILAQTIKAIEEGKETKFLTSLISEWEENYKRIIRSDVYLPLEKKSGSKDDLEQLARSQILKEASKLLTSLLKQKNI